MRRTITLVGAVLLAFGSISLYGAAASRPERTIVLLVRAIDSKPVGFSGWYQSDESKDPFQVTIRHSRFGMKLTTESLKGSFRAESGSPDLFVEIIEFTGNMEAASMSGQGRAFEFEVQPTGDGSLRAVSGS